MESVVTGFHQLTLIPGQSKHWGGQIVRLVVAHREPSGSKSALSCDFTLKCTRLVTRRDKDACQELDRNRVLHSYEQSPV